MVRGRRTLTPGPGTALGYYASPSGTFGRTFQAEPPSAPHLLARWKAPGMDAACHPRPAEVGCPWR
ncbi:protein of unknown function [Candidatus Methylocalor cossyra]|uniref:Uncharacterized protein n=1 Tax=Candidatus Methylocalor cossyra TaxID=3108543 RepID=A0ABM9NM15_9GAMM